MIIVRIRMVSRHDQFGVVAVHAAGTPTDAVDYLFVV